MSEKLTVEIGQDYAKNFQSEFSDLVDDVKRTARGSEQSLSNKKGFATVKKDGQVNLGAGKYSHFKMNPNGSIQDISYQREITTNRFKVEADDIIINNHKLNSKLYELSDFKRVLNTPRNTEECTIGGLTMLGTVLTKAWEPNLKRYVLIRRLVNIPMFSPSLGNTDVHPGLKITPNTSLISDMVNEIAPMKSINEAMAKMESMAKKNKEEKENIDAVKNSNGGVEEYKTDTNGKN